MNKNNIIITGTPRSGTTLVCYLLNKLGNTVALHEPIIVKNLFGKSQKEIVEQIEDFFTQTRKQILNTSQAISKNIRGKVPDNPAEINLLDMRKPVRSIKNISELLLNKRFIRKSRANRGLITINKTIGSNFQLCIKHPAAFTALIDPLSKKIPTYAIIRNPLATLASWNSVVFNVSDGHSPTAENLDKKLKYKLSRISNKYDRQVNLLDWFYKKYKKHLNPKNVIYYENIVRSKGTCLKVINRKAKKLNKQLENKNTNKLYNKRLIPIILQKLTSHKNTYYSFYYSNKEIIKLADKFYE